jgi:glycosyltransferase involved in cell wall biosynthesis
MRQTIKPSSVTVIDDGSDDDTADVAEAFAAANGFAVRVIRRRRSIGKTPGLKIESRNLEGDVQFILDADTVLESEDYIEQVASQLFRVPGIASACGMVYPLRERDRMDIAQLETVRRLHRQQPHLNVLPVPTWLSRLSKTIGSVYRETVHQFMQVFFYAGVQHLFGSIMHPVGCAVAYRREYLKDLFDRYEPAMGDNMTSSEDIFFGGVFIASGYRNTQTGTVIARTDEPEVHRMPRQLVKWSSAWLQTAYYLPDVLMSPFRALRRYKHKKENGNAPNSSVIVDAYHQPIGMQFAKQLGRPAGWIMLFTLLEKVSYGPILLGLLMLGAWDGLLATVGGEIIVYTMLLIMVSKERRLEYAVKSICVAPIRYCTLVLDFVTIGRFLFDLASGRRDWRK